MALLHTLLFLLLYTQNSAFNPFNLFNEEVNNDLNANNASNDFTDALDTQQSGNPFMQVDDDENDHDSDNDNIDPITAVQRFDVKEAEEQHKISDRHWNENTKRGKYTGDAVCHELIYFLTQSGTNYDTVLNILQHCFGDKNITPFKMKNHAQLNTSLPTLARILLQAKYHNLLTKCKSDPELLRFFRGQYKDLLSSLAEYQITTTPKALSQVVISAIMTDTPVSKFATIITQGWKAAANCGKNSLELDSIRYVSPLICWNRFVMHNCTDKKCFLWHLCPCKKDHTALNCPAFKLSETNIRSLTQNITFNKNSRLQSQSNRNGNRGYNRANNFNRYNGNNNFNFRRIRQNREYRRNNNNNWRPFNAPSPYNHFMNLARPAQNPPVAPAQPAQPRR